MQSISGYRGLVEFTGSALGFIASAALVPQLLFVLSPPKMTSMKLRIRPEGVFSVTHTDNDVAFPHLAPLLAPIRGIQEPTDHLHPSARFQTPWPRTSQLKFLSQIRTLSQMPPPSPSASNPSPLTWPTPSLRHGRKRP